MNKEDLAFFNGYALLVGVGADLPVTTKDATALNDLLLDTGRAGYLRVRAKHNCCAENANQRKKPHRMVHCLSGFITVAAASRAIPTDRIVAVGILSLSLSITLKGTLLKV